MSDAALKLAIVRSDALMNFYIAERRAGADPLTANERTHEFAKRLDEIYETKLDVVSEVMAMEDVS